MRVRNVKDRSGTIMVYRTCQSAEHHMMMGSLSCFHLKFNLFSIQNTSMSKNNNFLCATSLKIYLFDVHSDSIFLLHQNFKVHRYHLHLLTKCRFNLQPRPILTSSVKATLVEVMPLLPGSILSFMDNRIISLAKCPTHLNFTFLIFKISPILV